MSNLSSAVARVLRHVQEQLSIHAGETVHLVLITPTGPSTFTLVGEAPSSRVPAAGGHPPTNGCVNDLLKVIRAAGKRLTVQRLLEELKARRDDLGVQAWSETKASNTATAMVQLGLLTTSKVTNPPGYGLPEWGDGPGPGTAFGPLTPSRNGLAHAGHDGEGDERDER